MMSQNETIMTLFTVAILFLIILWLLSDAMVRRAKSARAARVLQAAAERAREADLLARYRRTTAPVDMAALEAELMMEFGKN